MILYGTSVLDASGELCIGGWRASDLKEQFGTPLYVYDEEYIRASIQSYHRAFARTGVDYALSYACKAFCTVAMSQLAREENMWLDVVSGGELHTALQAGVDPAYICMHGNNKSPAELLFAIKAGIGMIVIDNFYEIELLAELLEQEDATIDALLRVSPGVDVHTHEFIATGRQDSKFGFDLYSGQVDEALDRLTAHPRIQLLGLHSHIGSQIFDADGFRVAASRLASLSAHLGRRYGIWFRVLNLGGGMGIRYTSEDSPIPVERLVEGIVEATVASFKEYGIPLPRLMMEPGRSIVAQAGTTLYTVGSRKEIQGVRTYVAVDGGMTDNPRLALYGAKYEACIANRVNDPEMETVSIAGKCCESGDMLIWDVALPNPAPGDILAVSCTGAYNYSMASNYNRVARPAVVFVRNSEARLVVERETLADLCRLDRSLDSAPVGSPGEQ